MRLENRVAVVTGAGRNIGEAIAQCFAREGARVAVIDLDLGQAMKVAGAINADRPGAAFALAADVSAGVEVQRFVGEVVDHFGGIDILVNNVAITDRKTVLDLEEEEWDRVMAITLKSVFLCSKHVARRMVDHGRGGRIINLSSTSGHLGRVDATAYPTAKAGILNLTRSLAVQLAPYSIRVNSITPNQIGSPVGMDHIPESRQVRNLVGRMGMPPDIAAAALFLASDESAFIDGADILVDGGVLAGGMPFSSPIGGSRTLG